MDTKKIGRYIAECRKAKGYTQEMLAQKIGVTNKTISRWENGNYMPDISLLIPLSEILGVSLNELLSGEKIAADDLPMIAETTLADTLKYGNDKLLIKKRQLWFLIGSWGIFMIILAFGQERRGIAFALIGTFLIASSIYMQLKTKKRWVKISVSLLIYAALISGLMAIDYIKVLNEQSLPIFAHKVKTADIIVYRNPFYNVYQLNPNSTNEYLIIDTKKEYSESNVPRTPFARDISGIESLARYKNPYLGNNSNTGNLLNHLPLAEYGVIFEIDDVNCGLIVNYQVTDWYVNADHYVEQGMVYNTLALFGLIDNLEYVRYNFSGRNYQKITRQDVETCYPLFDDIFSVDKIDQELFNEKIEKMINDKEQVSVLFAQLFKTE